MEQFLESKHEYMELQGSIDLKKLREDSVMFEMKKTENAYEIENEKYTEEAFKDMFLNITNDADNIDDLYSTSFEDLAKKMTDISGDGGVLKKEVKPGEGPLMPSDAIVRVHYNGFFEFADEPFDSSRLRGEIFKFRLQKNMVIPGWVIAVKTMKKGEISRFLISPKYSFGELGCPPRIPKTMTALFEIEILSFVEEAGTEDYDHMTDEEKSDITFEQLTKMVNMEKSLGTEFFQRKQLQKSYSKYRLALLILEEYYAKNSEEDRQVQQLQLPLHLNMALCCLRLNHLARAVSCCQKALDIDKNNAKALYRLGQAYQELGRFKEATSNLKLAQKQLPSDSNISQQLQKLHNDVIKYKQEESNIYRKMFSQVPKETKSGLLASNLETAVRDAEEKSVAISKEFQENVTKYLKKFLSEKCQDECPMPAYSMSVAEIAYVLEIVDQLDLRAVQTGSGENMYIRIRKPSSKQLKKDEVVLR